MAASPQQVARLEAGARAGTAGTAAFDEAQKTVSAGRDQAIRSLATVGKAAGAPGALTAELSAKVAQPAAVALGNLGQMGAVAGSAAASERSATDNYMREANAALPLIRADADRDLGQKIALLNASKSGGGGGGRGGVSSLSDSEVRTRLMGLVLQQRQIAATNAQAQNEHAVQTALTPDATSTWGDAGGVGAQLFSKNDASLENAIKAAVPSDGGPPRPQPQSTIDAQQAALQAAITQIKQQQYGPGISNEAVALAPAVGIDPGLATGLFTPQVDANYVAANKKLGLYRDPNTVTNSTLDPVSAGQNLFNPSGGPGEQLSPKQVQDSMNQHYFDWTSKSLNDDFAKWVKTLPPDQLTGTPDAQGNPTPSPEQIPALQQAFESDPQTQRLQKPLVGDLVAGLQKAARGGNDLGTTWSLLQQDPAFQRFPREFALAVSIVRPVFEYYAAVRQHQTATPVGG